MLGYEPLPRFERLWRAVSAVTLEIASFCAALQSTLNAAGRPCYFATVDACSNVAEVHRILAQMT